MGNVSPSHHHHSRDLLRAVETNRLIDQELERRQRDSSMTVRILFDNVSSESVLSEVLQAFGTPLTYDDQNLYRIVLQSKLLFETQQLCQQLQKQNLVQDLSSDFKSSRRLVLVEDNEDDDDDDDDNDFIANDQGFRKRKTAMNPRDAFDKLVSVFAEDLRRPPSTVLLAGIHESICQRASPAAIVNSQLVIRYADHIRILWLSRTVHNFFMFQKVNPRWNSGLKQYTREDVLRLTSPTFFPEPKDLSGISVPFPVITRIRINGADFEIHDIGGLSSPQRRQHVHYFDHADVFIFAASLAQYDEPAMEISAHYNNEGLAINKLASAINEYQFFLSTDLKFCKRRPIVLLTQKDMFAAKMQYSNLEEQFLFSDFQGTPFQGVDYIVKKFTDFSREEWALIQVLAGPNRCSVGGFMDSLRQSLMSGEGVFQSTE